MAIEKLRPTSNVENFTHILHLADIHIRLTKRHQEYRDVFSKLYADVERTPNTTLVAVLGDIVHNKSDLTPECVQLIKEFLYNLAELRPTVVVTGNHDTNLANKNRLDCLSPVVEAINHPNLFYLKKSGYYGINNILITNYSVFDQPESLSNLKDIPEIYRNEYKYRVALYHGAVDNAMTDLGFRLTNKSVQVSLFDNHDIALLGDIHMMQDLQEWDDNTKPAIHYCGSLIQQNHGESLIGHGYSLWDLQTRTYNHIEIHNEYGYFTVILDNGKIISKTDNIPKKASIKFQIFESVATEVKSALSQLRLVSDVVDVCYENISNDSETQISTGDGTVSLGDISDRNYQIKLLTEYLNKRLNISDVDFINKIIKVNDDTNSLIKKDDFAKNIRWVPIRFEWDNMFSYGEDNEIDFTKVKDVVGIFASNTAGKSSIFSALSFCIFDKCEREFKAANVLNTQKTSFRCKFEFEIEGKRYFIERKGKADRKGNVKVDVRFWTIENGQDKDLHGEDRRDTNEVIREYVGSYEDFILTAMSVQSGKNNGSVIDMGNTERKDLLAQFMGLSVFDRLHTEANNRLKELSVTLKNFKNVDYTKNLLEYQNSLSQSESAFAEETKLLEQAQEEVRKVNDEILVVSNQMIKIDANIPTIEQSTQQKTSSEKSLTDTQKEIEVVEKNIAEVEALIPPISKEIDLMEEKDIENSSKKYQTLLATKSELENKLLRKKMEVDRNFEKINREKNHAYNRTCKFCLDNSTTIIKEAEEAHDQNEKDKVTVKEYLSELQKAQEELNQHQWTVEANSQYTQLLTKRSKHQSEQIRLTNHLGKLKANLNQHEQSIQTADKNIELFNKNKEAIEKNNELTNSTKSLKVTLLNYETNVKAKNKRLVELNGKISVYKTEIDNINKKITDAKLVEEEYKLYDVYTQAVNRDGIPFDVITVTVPQVEREVNSILSQICSFHAKFETDGKNVIPYIVYDGTGKWLMTLTSGFEKFALSLAIRVALINISNLPRPNFLVIDEGFGVLDSENLSSMQVLFSYLKSNFEFIMVISHLEAMRDMVDKQIEISKDKGFSKVAYV
jgi:DNA repair exonuclease SbcCD ATPase subunit/predicted MPP superfamily phosphohydrolase